MNGQYDWQDKLSDLTKQAKKIAKQAQESAKIKKSAESLAPISFADAVGKVHAIKNKNLYVHKRECEYIVPRRKIEDDCATEGVFVGKDSEFEPPRQYAAGGEGKNDIRKLLSGKLPIIATLDLHGYQQDEAQKVLNEFIEYVQKRGVCGEIIHGSGLGSHNFVSTLKSLVRRWLMAHPQVMAYTEPNAHNDGAVLILLKRKRSQNEYE